MKRRAYLLLMVIFIIPSSAFAILPVIDPAEILKTVELINQAKDQITKLSDLQQLGKDQLGFLQKNLNGNFGYGNFLNGNKELSARQWSNGSWLDVLAGKNTGSSSAFADAQKEYEKMYPLVGSGSIATSRTNGGLARTYYQQSSQISRAALAASSMGYDKINDHIQRLHDILAELEKEPNKSEKAAIEINARLVAELGFIQLELLRQQTIQNQLAAMQSQGNVNGMSDEANFMKWNP